MAKITHETAALRELTDSEIADVAGGIRLGTGCTDGGGIVPPSLAGHFVKLDTSGLHIGSAELPAKVEDSGHHRPAGGRGSPFGGHPNLGRPGIIWN